jgi:hypothetical protein
MLACPAEAQPASRLYAVTKAKKLTLKRAQAVEFLQVDVKCIRRLALSCRTGVIGTSLRHAPLKTSLAHVNADFGAAAT